MNSRIHDMMTAVLEDPRASRERKRLVYEFGSLLGGVEAVASSATSPGGSREKAQRVLAFFQEKEREHGSSFFHETYMLNIVGEAMARESYLAQPMIAFLRSALYFHGINWVERCQRSRSLAYLTAHADLVMEVTSRPSLKSLVKLGRERLENGRPFCISNLYLAELKKRYWAQLRQSEDACDQSVSLDEGLQEAASAQIENPMAPVDRDSTPITSEDRVEVMLRAFAEDLSELQQRTYLLRHPVARDELAAAPKSLEEELAAFLDGEPDGEAGRARWTDIARKLEVSEKVAKREYLLALHGLLAGAARRVFGDRLPSGFVRRVLTTLRTITGQRNLRIRESAGRGLPRLVERWEIALRFVLNHDRSLSVVEGDGGDEVGQAGL